jgi:hypothetical protein
MLDDILDTAVWMSMVVMFMSVVFLFAWMYPPMHEAKKMDCALAEFSPDISTEIKQLCREAKGKK